MCVENIKKNELGEFEAEKENECNANSDLNTTQENVVENGPDATCNSTTPKVKVETVNDLVRKSLSMFLFRLTQIYKFLND